MLSKELCCLLWESKVVALALFGLDLVYLKKDDLVYLGVRAEILYKKGFYMGAN